MKVEYGSRKHSLVAQQVKDPVFPLLWHQFNRWPRNFPRLQMQPPKKGGIALVAQGLPTQLDP